MARVPLTPIPVDVHGPIFEAIASWPFADEFVLRILTEDIPQRVIYLNDRMWAYRDPESNLVYLVSQ
jgi:hypothetical protein